MTFPCERDLLLIERAIDEIGKLHDVLEAAHALRIASRLRAAADMIAARVRH